MENGLGDKEGGKEDDGETTLVTEIRYHSSVGQSDNGAGLKSHQILDYLEGQTS